MADIARLTVALHANSAQFVADLQRSKMKSKSWSKEVSKSFKSMTKTTKAMASTASISAGVVTATSAAMAAAIKASLNGIDEMTRTAANLSIPVQKFGDLAYAAKLSGSSMDQVADVIKDISVRIQDAAFSGSGAMVDFFSQINQDAKDWAQLSPDQQFKKFVDEINKMDANQARFWLDEINDSAAEMFGTLYGSNAAFNQFRAEAEKAGLSISQNMARNSQLARIEFDRFGALATGTWKNVIASSAPAFQYVAEGLNGWILDSAKAEGGFNNLGKTLSISMLNAIQTVTHSFFAMTDEFKNTVRDMGRVIGKDWFVTPDFTIANRQLGFIQERMEDINGEIHKASLTNKWMTVSGRQAEEYKKNLGELHEQLRQLRMQEAQIKSKMTFKTDTSGFDAQIKAMMEKIKNASSSGDDEGEDKGGVKPKGNSKSPIAIAQEQALISYKAATEQMVLEQQRRLALLAAGDNAALLQEAYNNQDRMAKLDADYQLELDNLKNNQDAKLLLKQEYDQAKADMEQAHQQQMAAIQKQESKKNTDKEKQNTQMLLGSSAQLFDGLAGIGETFSGKQSAMYKTMFAASKAFSIAESIMAIQTGIANAAKLTFPANIPAMATVAASTAGIVSTISSTQLSGMAHSGISEIPKEGTWLLDKGERVYTNRSAKQIDQMQSAIAGLGNSIGSVNWSINIENNQPDTKVETYIDDEKKIVSVVLSDINSSGQIYNSLSRKLGISGGGWK